MEKPIYFQNSLPATTAPPAPTVTAKNASQFSSVLSNSLGGAGKITQHPEQNTENKGVNHLSPPPTKPVLIGTTSQSQPTVSELLLNNREFADKGWEIIFSKQNSDKAYTRIPLGTSIFLDPKNGELSWSRQDETTNDIIVPPSTVSEKEQSNGVSHETFAAKNTQGRADNTQSISLGSLDAKNPSVSHLLSSHPKLARDTWNILDSAANKNKNYRVIPEGVEITLNLQTNEINWKETIATTELKQTSPALEKLQAMSTVSQLQVETPLATEMVSLGTINSFQPTVSHLIKNNPGFAGQTWQLLSSPINSNKSFNKIPPGTEIYLNQATGELKWNNSNRTLKNIVAITPNNISQDEMVNPLDLTEAVQPFMGKSYKEINCYNLLVKGLNNMGLPYSGKDGLRHRLTSMAREKGLPSNAYLNGEGIVKAAGSKVLSHSFNSVNDWPEEAGKTFEEMERVLQKGQILSFSTPTRGHTGIISQHNEKWTFINSGRMDNHVDQPTRPREVGEETLVEEIRNWFKTANKNNESLVVTLGQLEADKIRNNVNPDFQRTHRL